MTEVTRRVPAGGVLLGYCQAAMIKAIAEGRDRGEASAAGWELLRTLVKATTGYLLPPPGESVGGGVVRTPTNCLAITSYSLHETLQMDWDEWCAENPGDNVPVTLPEGTLVKLAMLIDCVYRVSNGVEPLVAARQAFDYSLGRPRQRRRPADPEWLIGRVNDVQGAVWRALIDQDVFRGALPADPPAISGGR
jgi:hypothetical protein